MNVIHLMGRLTKDPEIRVSQEKQVTIAKFCLAVDRAAKKGESDFFYCTAFGKKAEVVEKYMKKGTKIALSGKMQMDSYTDKGGTKRTSWNVVVDEIEFAESKKESQDSAKASHDGFMEIPDGDEELPFNFG